MNATDIIICPGCGWVGGPNELDSWGGCPACEYHFGDGPLPTVTEMMKDSTTTYNDVRMDLFLRSFIELLTSCPQILRIYPQDSETQPEIG